jgi:hypothetical protein
VYIYIYIYIPRSIMRKLCKLNHIAIVYIYMSYNSVAIVAMEFPCDSPLPFCVLQFCIDLLLPSLPIGGCVYRSINICVKFFNGKVEIIIFSAVSVLKRSLPFERSPLVGDFNANFC